MIERSDNMDDNHKERLEYLRGELRAERISYSELHELQWLTEHMADEDKQQKRRKRLQELADDYHRSRYGDYDAKYEEFAATYGLVWQDTDYSEDTDETVDDDVPAFASIPQYASLHSDDTYGMIYVFDSLDEALRNQTPAGEGTFGVPYGVIDLDTGKMVKYRMVAFAEETMELLKRALDDAAYYRLGDEAANADQIEEYDDRVLYLAYLDLMNSPTFEGVKMFEVIDDDN